MLLVFVANANKMFKRLSFKWNTARYPDSTFVRTFTSTSLERSKLLESQVLLSTHSSSFGNRENGFTEPLSFDIKHTYVNLYLCNTMKCQMRKITILKY